MARRKEIQKRLDDEDEEIETKEREALYDQLNTINEAMGYPVVAQDDLVDQWERELAEGKIPDV